MSDFMTWALAPLLGGITVLLWTISHTLERIEKLMKDRA